MALLWTWDLVDLGSRVASEMGLTVVGFGLSTLLAVVARVPEPHPTSGLHALKNFKAPQVLSMAMAALYTYLQRLRSTAASCSWLGQGFCPDGTRGGTSMENTNVVQPPPTLGTVGAYGL